MAIMIPLNSARNWLSADSFEFNDSTVAESANRMVEKNQIPALAFYFVIAFRQIQQPNQINLIVILGRNDVKSVDLFNTISLEKITFKHMAPLPTAITNHLERGALYLLSNNSTN